ncbi:hypothetical protein FACS189475_04400 [Betaproteobacteria bacterium]|nr:hypothetical protein FACS189475_04400 [Betaproteobacteria bacterium]
MACQNLFHVRIISHTCTSLLAGVDRRRLVFEVLAEDEKGEIGRGRHERFIIDTVRFMARL